MGLRSHLLTLTLVSLSLIAEIPVHHQVQAAGIPVTQLSADSLRQQAAEAAAASQTQQQEAQTLIEAQDYDAAHQVIEGAIATAQQAIDLATQALEVGRATQDETITAALYAELSERSASLASAYGLQTSTYQSQNNLAAALTAQQNAFNVWVTLLETIKQWGNPEQITLHRSFVANEAWGLSIAHFQLGQYQEAAEVANSMLSISQDISASKLELGALWMLSQISYDLGEQARISENYTRALDHHRSAQAHVEQMLQLSERPLDQLPNPSDIPEFALLKTTEDQTFFQTQGLTQLHIVLSGIGITYSDQQQYAAALDAHQQALEIVQRLDNAEQIGSSLLSVATLHKQLEDYDTAIEVGLQLEQLAQANDNIHQLRLAYTALASYHDDLGLYPKAFDYYESARRLIEEQGDQQSVAAILNNLGTIAAIQGDYTAATDFLNQALTNNRQLRDGLSAPNALETLADYCFSWRSLGWEITNPQTRQYAEQILQGCLEVNLSLESKLLNNLGSVYEEKGRYPEAIELHEQALELTRRHFNSPADESVHINNIGVVYYAQGNYPLALELYNQALALDEQVNNRAGMISTLTNIGVVYQDQGDYALAQDYHQQALNIARDIGLKPEEVTVLGNVGALHSAKGDYTQAEQYYQQSLQLAQSLQFRPDQALRLLNLSLLNNVRGQYDTALNYVEQGLAIQREIGQRSRESDSLQIRGDIYLNQGKFSVALSDHETALTLARQLDDLDETADALASLGRTYERLGQAEQAQSFYQEALDIYTTIGAVNQQSVVYNALGSVAAGQNQYRQALDLYQQALAINQAVGAVGAESVTLTNIGNAHYHLDNLSTASEALTQALAIQQRIGQGADIGRTINSLALVSAAQKKPTEAVRGFQQALVRHRSQGDRTGEAKTLSNLGKLMVDQGQTELGGVFLKQAVNVYETIRNENRVLDPELQNSYTETVAETYRQLADVLLTQGRIPEAQRVLDLLKIEELREFTSQTRATWRDNGIEYSELEQSVIESHGDLISFGQTLYECEQTSCDQLSNLYDQQEQLNQAYNQQVNAFETTVRDNRYDDDNFQDPNNLGDEAQELLAANPDSVLLYPFVTDQKLWLLYASLGSTGVIEIDVSQGELSSAVQQLGAQLNSGRSDLSALQSTSQQLHDWLISPLEAILQENETKHLIFVNDRVTRYIPMAALYDGERYLLEKYAISSILSTQVTDTTERLGSVSGSQVLGLGLTKAVAGFSPLPAVEQELDAIVRTDTGDANGIYPGQVHLNERFTLEQLKTDVLDHQVLHIATHAEFVPGRPDDSFIVLGDGSRLKGTDIDNMGSRLNRLHLVVLSACQTALGGAAGDGTEIAGMSAYFLEKRRAESVLASLWAVNDESTSLLMQRFYELLASGELTKAEALQQAQLSLLYDQDVDTRLEAIRRGDTFFEVATWDGQPVNGTSTTEHPYYWAPFILIGNAL